MPSMDAINSIVSDLLSADMFKKGEVSTKENNPESVCEDPIVALALKKLDASRVGIEKWRKQACEARTFRSGKQYEQADLEILNRERRPSAVFNVAQKFIRVISGLERRTREHVDFVPVEVSSTETAFAGDVVTKVYQWAVQQCHGEEERSRAFEDKIVDGLGWTEIRLDTNNDPSGMITIDRVDAMEMLWDTNSRKVNLVDGRWVARVRMIPFEEAEVRWPDKKDKLLLMKAGGMPSGQEKSQTVELFNWMVAMSQFGGPQPNSDTLGIATQKNLVPIVDFQWQEMQPGYFFYDPLDKEDAWLDDKAYKKYQDRLERLQYPEITEFVRQMRPKYQRILFTGRWRLSDPVELPGQRFTYNAMTGEWDDEDKYWYGFMRLLMDPQKFANKFLNQVLEIMQSQSKGGLFAETDAFENPRQAEDRYARTGTIMWMREGGADKIKEKQLPQLPTASINLLQFCIKMMDDVAGFGAEAFGMATGETPVGTTQQRKEAHVALLASEFSALKMYRIEEAKTIFDFFQFISDGRLIRVGHPTAPEIIQLVRDPFLLNYDIVLEESDTDPRVKERYWESILALAPMLIRTNHFIPELLDFAPLPRRIIENIKQKIVEEAKAAQEMAQRGEQPVGKGGKTKAETDAKIQKMNADTALSAIKAEAIQKELGLKGIRQMMDTIVNTDRLKSEDLKRKAMSVDILKNLMPTPQR